MEERLFSQKNLNVNRQKDETKFVFGDLQVILLVYEVELPGKS